MFLSVWCRAGKTVVLLEVHYLQARHWGSARTAVWDFGAIAAVASTARQGGIKDMVDRLFRLLLLLVITI